MRNKQIDRVKSILANLTKYIYLNQKYYILVCIRYRKAVCLYKLVRYLEQFYRLGVGRVGNRLRQYIKAFKYNYKLAIVENPVD